MGGVGKSSGVTGSTQQVAPTPPEPPKPSLGDYWRTPGSLDGRVSKAAGLSERTRVQAQRLFEQAFGAIADADPIFDKALRSMLRKGPGGITMSLAPSDGNLLGTYSWGTREVKLMDRGLANLQNTLPYESSW